VHRIIKTSILNCHGPSQHPSNNQLVVLNLPDSSMPISGQGSMSEVEDRMLIEKIDNTIREYNYLLTS
jgi:hypothetical protein